MAASENGSLYHLQLSFDDGTTYKTIANQTEVTLTRPVDMREIVSATNGGWKDREVTKKDYNLSVNSLYTIDNATYHNANEVEAENGNTVLWKLVPVISQSNDTPLSGGVEVSGTAILHDVEATYPDGENAQLTATLSGKGALTTGVVPE